MRYNDVMQSSPSFSSRTQTKIRIRLCANWANITFVLAYAIILTTCFFAIRSEYLKRVELNEKLDRIEKAVMDQYRR